MDNDVMLTTMDNPFDPFIQWDQWYSFDEQMGYNTCGYIDRIAYTAEDLSPPENQRAIELAIDEIIDMNVTGNYKKVFRKES